MITPRYLTLSTLINFKLSITTSPLNAENSRSMQDLFAISDNLLALNTFSVWGDFVAKDQQKAENNII